MPSLKAIHICNSHQPTLHQKSQKSMILPALKDNEKEVRPHNNVSYKNPQSILQKNNNNKHQNPKTPNNYK